jgi:hypothetical protein
MSCSISTTRALPARKNGIKSKHVGTGGTILLKNYGTVGYTFEPCRVHSSAATTYDNRSIAALYTGQQLCLSILVSTTARSGKLPYDAMRHRYEFERILQRIWILVLRHRRFTIWLGFVGAFRCLFGGQPDT